MENPQSWPSPHLEKGQGPIVMGWLWEKQCLTLPMVQDSLWWSLLLIWDPGSPQGWSRARSFPIPGYARHWHGQLELKTTPLAQGKSNHGSAFCSIWKSDGTLGEGNHTSCTACICGLKIIKLGFFCCTVQNSFLESISVLWEAAGWCFVIAWHGWK